MQKVWCSRYAQGARSSLRRAQGGEQRRTTAGADGPLLLCPQILKLFGPFPSRCFSVGRLPIFGADPLRSATIHPVPREETWRPEAQGRGGWRQARAVGDLTRGDGKVAVRLSSRRSRRGSNLLTQTGRISPEEPRLTESLVDLDK